MLKDYKKILVTLLILFILFGIVIRIFSLNRDFIAEETEFVKPAIAIKETGHPRFYHSEQQPEVLALAHPPMYIFLLGGIFKIFSVSEISARSINILFSIFTALLIFLFCSKIIGDSMGERIGLVSCAFFIINYYVFSSSVQIDIDMLSTFFVFSFVFCVLMYYKTGKNYLFLLSIISLFFSLANRYPIAILVYICIGIYYFFNDELKKDFKRYILIGLISLISFVIAWGIYSTFIEPGNFFSFLFHNVKFGAEQFLDLKIYIGSFFLNITQFIRLFTLPALLLIIISIFSLFNEKSRLIKILLIYVLPTFFFFLMIPRPAFGYPRYFLSIIPGFSILIGIFLYKNLVDLKSDNKIWIILFSFIISLILLIGLGPQPTIYASNGLIKAFNLPNFAFNLLASSPLLFVVFFKENRKKVIILILIGLLLSYSLYFDFKLVTYNSHIKEVANYIKEKTNITDVVIVPKAIGYYTNRKFYVNDNNKPDLNFSISYLKEYIKKSYENPKMDDEFFWPGGFYGGTSYYGLNPSEEELRKAAYAVLYHPVGSLEPEIKIGDFYVYKLNS